jgi:hypothetical protein
LLFNGYQEGFAHVEPSLIFTDKRTLSSMMVKIGTTFMDTLKNAVDTVKRHESNWFKKEPEGELVR